MAEVIWTPDEPLTTGKIPTVRSGLTQTDTFKFLNDGKTTLRLTAGATEVKAKVAFVRKVDGVTIASREVVVKEQTKILGPFDPATYNDENGYVTVTFTATTGLTVEVVKVPPVTA